MDSNRFDGRTRGRVRIKAISSYEILDERGSRVCQELKMKWNQYKNSSFTSRVLTGYFENSSNPYVAALEMMVNSQDFYLNKQNSLAMFVMVTFGKWKAARNESFLIRLTDKIKLDAFNLMLGQKNTSLLNIVIKEYKLIDDKMRFLQPLREYLHDTKNYKELCDWALGLQLYDQFVLEDFVVPLLLQGKFQVAQMYLEKNRCLRAPMIAFLDSILVNRHTETELANIAHRLQVSDVKLNQLGFKSLSKLESKLLKMFNLPTSLAPNLVKSKGRGALSFLLHKKFVEKSISEDGWTEMVLEAVQSDATLHLELVIGVAAQGDLKNALEWALRFSVPKHRWPPRLQQFVDRSDLQSSNQRLADRMEWDTPRESKMGEEYHTLRISEANICLVDNMAGLQNFIDELNKKNVKLVGIDAEWKPTFGFKKCDLALFQVATLEKIYILDVIKLNLADYSKEAWEKLASGFFANPSIVKLGFGMSTDLLALKDIFRKRGITKAPETGFLDICTVVVSLIEHHKIVFPHGVPKTNNPKENPDEGQISISLSNLVKFTLGKNLNKSDQFSNWERRPLRRDQIIYAALDAYCLLEVYEVLIKECEKQKICLEEVINGVKNSSVVKIRSGRKKRGDRAEKKKGPKRVTEFRILCDKPLGEVGKLMRKCGIDTTIADLKQELRAADFKGKLPLYVITARPDYNRFNRLGQVYCVKTKDLKDQLIEVLKNYNVKVAEEDLHTRCKECNSTEFEAFTREELEKLMNAPRSSRPEESSRFYEDVSDVNEFDGQFAQQSYYPSQETTGRSKTKNGVVVRCADIPANILKNVPMFCVCTVCGTCYWEGSQKEPRYERVFKDIVTE